MIEARGGARISWVDASWPFARLSASSDRLALDVAMLGSYEFQPDHVVSLDIHGWLRRGIRIQHVRSDYPKHIVFWQFGSGEKLLQDIRATGFMPRAQPQLTAAASGIPFRWSAIFVSIAIWNALFLLDRRSTTQPGVFAAVALFLLFSLAWCAPRSSWLQRMLLKPGRSVGEVKPILHLFRLVAGMLLVLLTLELLRV